MEHDDDDGEADQHMRQLAVLGDRDDAAHEDEQDEDIVDVAPPGTFGVDQRRRDEDDADEEHQQQEHASVVHLPHVAAYRGRACGAGRRIAAFRGLSHDAAGGRFRGMRCSGPETQ